MKNIAALLIAFFTLQLTTQAQGIEFVHDKSFDEIRAMAKAQNKLIFMDCYTTWCGPCKRLSAQVFPDSAVGAYYNDNFINTKFDMEKGEGVNLSGRYAIRAYPTLLWLDYEGNVKHKVVGGLDPAGLIANGKKATDPTPGILTGMREQYKNGNRDVNFLADYVTTLNSAGELYEPIFKEYVELLNSKQLSEKKHTQTIFNLTTNINSPGLAHVMKNKDYYKGTMGADVVNKKINGIAEKAVQEAGKKEDKAQFEKAIALVKENKAADATQQALKLSIDYYESMYDWTNYDKNVTQYIKKYAEKDAKYLNDAAWNYYINVNDEALLSKALKWSYQAVNLDNKYTNNLTYAYLRYKLNDYGEAEKACDYAIIKAKEEGVNASSATALKEAIQKSKQKQ